MRVVIFIKQYSNAALDSTALESLTKVAHERRCHIVKTLQAAAQDPEELHRAYQLMLGLARAGLIQKVFTPQLVSLGNKPEIVLERISQFKQEKVSIYIHSLGCDTLSPFNVWSDAFRPIFSVLEEFVSTAKMGTTSHLVDKKRRKKSKSRALSPNIPNYQLLEEYPNVVKSLKQGRTIKNTAIIYGLSEGLVRSIHQTIKTTRSDQQLSLLF